MTASAAPGQARAMTLRRQKARTVDGEPGGYTDAFEIICSDCGDDPRQDYQDVAPRPRPAARRSPRPPSRPRR